METASKIRVVASAGSFLDGLCEPERRKIGCMHAVGGWATDAL
jgi:hypothetical protein